MYRENYAFVWRCVRRFGVIDGTEDAVQEVFLTAFRRIDSYEARGSMRAWLGGISRRVAFRHRRTAERRHRRHEALLTVTVEQDDLDQWIGRREAERFLDDFLARLDPGKRSVFVLYELEGLRGKDFAEAVGVNRNTAHARLRAARELFARACAEARTDAPLDCAAVHKRDRPPPDAARRGWAALVAHTGWTAGKAGALTTMGLLGQVKVAALTFGIGTAGVLTVHAAAPPPDAAPLEQPRRVAKADADQAGDPPAPADPSPPPAPRPTTAPPATKAVPVSIPSPTKTGAVPDRATRRAPALPPTDLSGDEYDLLSAAQRAKRGERWSVALAQARKLLRRYPRSQLAIDARVIVVKALCRLDRDDEARDAAKPLGRARREHLLAAFCG